MREGNRDLRASTYTRSSTGWNDTYLRHLDHRIHFLDICQILAMEVDLCSHTADPDISGGSEDQLT